jgi:hypothetical protein
MDHLDEIDDAATRDGVHTFQAQMEIIVLSLLHNDRATALRQIEEARVATLEYTENLGSAYLSPAQRAKSARVAQALLRHTFSRLRTVIDSPDDDEPAGATAI